MKKIVSVFRRLRCSEGVKVILPFVIFFAVLTLVPHWEKIRNHRNDAASNGNPALADVVLQAKDPKDNRFRRIQLQHSYSTVCRIQHDLSEAQAQNDHQRVTEQKALLHDACVNYDIVAAETDDSVFAQTHLPKNLPTE